MHPVRPRNHKRKHNVRPAMTLGFVVLALLVAGIISQVPPALGDDSNNPFSALWDAIFDLQSRDDDLQAQIDELRSERNMLSATGIEPVFVSDLYTEIEIEATEDGHTLVYITTGNSGPDRAVAVKATAFYLMPLFEINSIEGDRCEDMSRGIIECALGTLEADQESVITIDATARESGKTNTWTVDISTTTDDADYVNNHVTYDFETGSGKPIEIPEVEQPEEQEESADDLGKTEAEPESEQDNLNSDNISAETEESQEISGNQTSTENELEETPSGNQTPSDTVEDSGSNSTSSETQDDQSSESEESSSEEVNEEGVQEEQGQEEQGTPDESGTDESVQDGTEAGSSESGSESSDSSEQESNASESGDSGESPSQ